ncbi:SU10 major capsid protein [Enterococcus sp. JM9B]|uniref:SU10 major capsid protein n=1 Tax=Enterococcus sp. JM9B TaxID=1857216 RepID=UPI001374A9E6|nr:DUF5309 family protein [Enterococcus sp. JM9B]KAF1304844.1 hypothetical protein BAU16_01345 [Enterococcus sp. JM9B]
MLTTDLTNQENIYLTDEIHLVAPKQTPFSTLLLSKKGNSETGAKIHSWRERTLDTSDSLAQEGADAGEGVHSTRAELSNVLQILSKTVKVSGTAQATEKVGDLFASEINDRLIEVKADLEKALLTSTKNDGSDGKPRKMSGLIEFADPENLVQEPVSETAIKELARKLWEKGFEGENLYLFVNADIKEELDSLYKDKYFYPAKTNDFGLLVNTIETNYGVINVVLDRYMPTEKAVLFDLDQLSIKFLKGRQPHYEPLGKRGDNLEGLVLLEATLEVGSKKSVAVLETTTV